MVFVGCFGVVVVVVVAVSRMIPCVVCRVCVCVCVAGVSDFNFFSLFLPSRFSQSDPSKFQTKNLAAGENAHPKTLNSFFDAIPTF